MKMHLKWEMDPLVQLQDAVLPVLYVAPTILCRLLVAAQSRSEMTGLSDHFTVFETSEHHLRSCGAEFFGPAGIELAETDMAVCHAAADHVALVRVELQRWIARCNDVNAPIDETVMDALNAVTDRLAAKVNAANDTFRRVFITTILNRQRSLARQAQVAIGQLSDISETIFFIGINASVEAARVGEEGRGFNVISEDIRRLATNARDSTAHLRTVLSAKTASA